MIDIELVVQQIDKKIASLEAIQHFNEFKQLENDTKENSNDKEEFKVRKWLRQTHNIPSSREKVEEREKRLRFKNKRYSDSQFLTSRRTILVEASSSESSDDKVTLKKLEPNKEFYCSICNKYLSASFSFIRHMQIHSNYRPHSCSICHHKFIQRSDLERHLVTHRRPQLSCKKCGLKFNTKKNLNIHKKFHLNPQLSTSRINFHNGVSFDCDYCRKIFKTKEHIQNHLKMHIIGGNSFEPRNDDERKLHQELISNR